MTEINRCERLQIMLNDDELRALDDWRFARRMPSRASAIRELLRRGLAAEGTELSRAGVKSKEYGVVGGAPKSASRKQSRSSIA
jgi:metal-responsive CopG/Arc/MetJ family transcriptional regulator